MRKRRRKSQKKTEFAALLQTYAEVEGTKS